jgi:hypothetical protein
MAYGQPHTETIPTVSSTLGPAYATMVNAVLTEMRTTLNAKVTPAGIDVNADLSLRSGATRYGLTDAHRLSLYQQPSLLSASTYPAALYANSAGELYFNDASGNQVQVTNSGGLNGTPGSITGAGYGSTGVEVNWDSSASDYHFYSGTGTYADLNCTAVQLSDGSSNLLRIAAPAMAANYTLTLPSAVPASTSVMQLSAAGVVSASPSGNIATTGTVATGALTVTGAATVSTTLGVTGLITASAGLTAAANQHVTVSGTGRFKHGTLQLALSPNGGSTLSGTMTAGTSGVAAAGVGDTYRFNIPIVVGKQITRVRIAVTTTGAGAATLALFRYNLLAGGAATSVASGTTSGASTQFVDISGLTETIASERAYAISFVAGNAGDVVHGANVYYDE